MAAEIMTFVPHGDLYLVLTFPSEEEQQPAPVKVINCDGSSGGNNDVTNPAFLTSNGNPSLSDMDVESSGGQESVQKSPKQIKMLVSSQCLMAASPVFRAMLQRNKFKEGHDLASGNAEIDLLDDDPSAFEILANIIHLRNRKVPHEVNLKTATNLSVLVDKYQMLEVVETYLPLWLPGLKKSLPESFTADLIPWLSVAWVFKFAVEFKHLTRILQLESWDLVGGGLEQQLPIPSSILEKTEDFRQRAISFAITVLVGLMEKYKGSKTNCKLVVSERPNQGKGDCDDLILGSLIRSADKNGLFPVPEEPFRGTTVKSIIQKLRALRVVALCDKYLMPKWDSADWTKPSRPKAGHGVMEFIDTEMITLERIIDGFELSDSIRQHQVPKNASSPEKDLINSAPF